MGLDFLVQVSHCQLVAVAFLDQLTGIVPHEIQSEDPIWLYTGDPGPLFCFLVCDSKGERTATDERRSTTVCEDLVHVHRF